MRYLTIVAWMLFKGSSVQARAELPVRQNLTDVSRDQRGSDIVGVIV